MRLGLLLALGSGSSPVSHGFFATMNRTTAAFTLTTRHAISLALTAKKTTAAFSVVHVEHVAMASTAKKTTAAFTVLSGEHVTPGATAKKTTAAFTVIAFAPTNLANLQFWIRGDKGITLSGSNVTAWADQSGTGDANKNLATSTVNPAFTATNASYNNRPTVDAVATTTMASGTWAASVTQPSTWYIVGNITNSGGEAFDGVGSRQIIFNSAGKWALYAGSTLASTVSATTKAAVCGVMNGGSSALYVSAATAAASGAGGALGFTKMFLFSGSGAAPMTGTIAEVIMYSGAHDATTRAQVMAYLGARYGISIGA